MVEVRLIVLGVEGGKVKVHPSSRKGNKANLHIKMLIPGRTE